MHTETKASNTVNECLMNLRLLTTGDPTTTELEEALRHERSLRLALLQWVSARHLIEAAPRCPLIQTETLEEAEELDRIEQAHPTTGVLNPIFERILSPMRPSHVR